MQVAAQTVLDVPQPSAGPSARFQLNDPTTQVSIVSVIVAILTTLWTSLGHGGLSSTLQLDLNSFVGLFVTTAMASKHFLSGKLVTRLGADAHSALAMVEQVDPQAVEQLKAVAIEAVPPIEAAVHQAAPALDPAMQQLVDALSKIVVRPAPIPMPAATVSADAAASSNVGQ